MQIEPGTSLLHYEVVEPLGKGGMGEVYRARDTKLGREVAIKILPEEFTKDAERLARFEREARVLAALDHPHVAAIYGFEDVDGVRFLVMQLAVGEDLSDRLCRGPIPVDEAIEIAKQIAEGLEAAHEQGIVHRDLKPANIKIDEEGKVRVLDFGLAKALETEESDDDFSNSPTMVRAATNAGVILGTAAYMSPEQARGKRVDKRADIWAFGVVLWEMLTGKRLFQGETVSDTLASVLMKEPDLSILPLQTPLSVRWVLERSLERNSRRRLRDIGEVRVALESPFVDGSREPSLPRSDRKGFGWWVAASAAVSLVAGVLATLGLMSVFSPEGPDVELSETRFRIDRSDAGRFTGLGISPDGRLVAWSDDTGVWIRRLDQLEPRRVDLPWDGEVESWTPDGRSLVVRRRTGGNGELWRVSLDGSDPAPIGALPKDGFLWGVSPGADGEILIGMADAGIFSLPVGGGVAKRVVESVNSEGLTAPFWLADRKALLFANVELGRIEAVVNGERRVVLERPDDRLFDPLVAPSGHLLFRLDSGKSASGIWAVPFSIERLEVSGEPIQLLPYGTATISRTGTIAFRERRTNSAPTQVVEVDRAGRVAASIGEQMPGMRSPALSPDGSLVVVSAASDDQSSDLFVLNRLTGARYALPDERGSDWFPFWRDGGKTIGFLTWSAGIREARERNADGSGEVRLLDSDALIASETPDGQYLVTSYYGTHYRKGDSSQPVKSFDEVVISIDFSPDSRWIVYSQLGEGGLFLRRFPEGGGLTPVVSGKANSPRFSVNGRELFFWENDDLMVVQVDLRGETPVVGRPEVLFSASSSGFDTQWNSFDVTPEGRFLMVQRVGESEELEEDPGIVILQGWVSRFTP